MRVAAGAIARKWLFERYGVVIRGRLSQIGPHELALKSWDAVGQNPFFSADPDIVPKLEDYMDELRRAGDSCGAKVTVVAEGVPVGWGEPVYDRLDADLAYAMMGINAVKGVEIGAGFSAIEQRGSEHGDEMTPDGFLSNHAGGVLGGISTGQDLVVHVALKPTSSIRLPRRSINKRGEPVTVETTGRHDPCVGIRATPIAEACHCVDGSRLASPRAMRRCAFFDQADPQCGRLTGFPGTSSPKRRGCISGSLLEASILPRGYFPGLPDCSAWALSSRKVGSESYSSCTLFPWRCHSASALARSPRLRWPVMALVSR